MKGINIAPPALILAFRRPENLVSCLESLHKAGTSRVYLAIDGPREKSDLVSAELIIETATEYCQSFKIKLVILRRQENLGLALSVLTALDWFFSLESEGLVIEDDLVFGQDFVRFCGAALKFFQDDKGVWVISGNNFNQSNKHEVGNAWTTYPMIWGWATWADRWPLIRSSIISSQISKRGTHKLRSYCYWRTGLRRVNLGILNSWAVPLAVSMHFTETYCLLPPVNLVSNIGVDSKAVHTSNPGWHSNWPIEELPQDISFSTANRKNIAQIYDQYFDEKVYQISVRHIFSLPLSILLDWARFPKNNRAKSLSEKFKNFNKN